MRSREGSSASFGPTLGRRLDYYDHPAVRQIVREAAASDYKWSSIVLGRSANSTGLPSNQDIDLGFLLRANGEIEVSQPGKPLLHRL